MRFDFGTIGLSSSENIAMSLDIYIKLQGSK